MRWKREFSLHDRRVDFMGYMDTSLEPGKYIAERDDRNHSTFNRAYGGYDGLHDYPLSQTVYGILSEPLETWHTHDAIYAMVPFPPNVDDPDHQLGSMRLLTVEVLCIRPELPWPEHDRLAPIPAAARDVRAICSDSAVWATTSM